MSRFTLAIALAILPAACGCAEIAQRAEVNSRSTAPYPSSTPHHTAAAIEDPGDSDDSDAALFRKLDESFGRKGEVNGSVYRLVTPRPDLLVTVNGMDVPTGAFLESDFRFWLCPCGKALVNGQFVVADYEANDVINELQLGHLEIASLAPLLLNEHPRLLLIRFQGEGRARQLATTLKSALSYTGEARSAPARPANPARIAP